MFFLSVEDMPAVKFAMFEFGDYFKICFSVVESVVVYMVNFQGWWTFGYQPVHTDGFCNTVPGSSGYDILARSGFQGEPLEVHQKIVIIFIDNSEAAVPDA